MPKVHMARVGAYNPRKVATSTWETEPHARAKRRLVLALGERGFDMPTVRRCVRACEGSGYDRVDYRVFVLK